jgi:hypothetical protein
LQLDYDNSEERRIQKESFKVVQNPAHDFVEYGAYSMNWPLFSFGDFLGNIYVVNLFDRSIMYRIPMGEHKDRKLEEVKDIDIKICCTYITQNAKLYILVLQTPADKKLGTYKLYELDLLLSSSNFNVEYHEKRFRAVYQDKEEMSLEIGQEQLLLEYDEDVKLEKSNRDGMCLLEDPFQLIVRDSDRFSTMGFRKRTFAFILHGRKLLFWMQNDEEANKVSIIQEDIHARRLRQISSDAFAFQVQSHKDDPGEIKKLQMHFMTY